MNTFWILLEQMELFVVYILAGVILVKTKVLNKEALRPIARFVLKMGLPLLIFTNIINGVEKDALFRSGSILVTAFLLDSALFLLSWLIAHLCGV